MVSISTQTASAYHITFKELADETDLETRARRVSRVSTLDGGSVVTDSGYTDTDRKLTIAARLPQASVDILKYIFGNYSLVTVSCSEGCFICAPQRIKPQYGKVVMTFLVAA